MQSSSLVNMPSDSSIVEQEAHLPKKALEKYQQNVFDQRSPQASETTSNPHEAQETQIYTSLIIQAIAACLFLVLSFLRRCQISILGYEAGLLFGKVPPECLLLSVILLSLGIRDLARSFAALSYKTNRQLGK